MPGEGEAIVGFIQFTIVLFFFGDVHVMFVFVGHHCVVFGIICCDKRIL